MCFVYHFTPPPEELPHRHKHLVFRLISLLVHTTLGKPCYIFVLQNPELKFMC